MKAKISGAIIGWKRIGIGNSVVLHFQVAESAEALQERNVFTVDLSLNNRRLASLIRDLERAADAAGVPVRRKRSNIMNGIVDRLRSSRNTA